MAKTKKDKLKFILVKTCAGCPYICNDTGGGFCEPYKKCEKFNILLYDGQGPEDFDVESGIHPQCQLDDSMKLPIAVHSLTKHKNIELCVQTTYFIRKPSKSSKVPYKVLATFSHPEPAWLDFFRLTKPKKKD